MKDFDAADADRRVDLYDAFYDALTYGQVLQASGAEQGAEW